MLLIKNRGFKLSLHGSVFEKNQILTQPCSRQMEENDPFCHSIKLYLKLNQNKKGQKIGVDKKKERTAFLSIASNFFGPSYFETALVPLSP